MRDIRTSRLDTNNPGRYLSNSCKINSSCPKINQTYIPSYLGYLFAKDIQVQFSLNISDLHPLEQHFSELHKVYLHCYHCIQKGMFKDKSHCTFNSSPHYTDCRMWCRLNK